MNSRDIPDNLDFTHQARKSFLNVARDPYFRDCDCDLIYEMLKKRIRTVPFGDYLKRYIYTKAEMEGSYLDIPVSVYQEIICAEFADRSTPCSFTKTSVRLRNAAKNWLEQQTVNRNVVLLLGFGLGMDADDVNSFLSKALQEPELNAKDPFEAICWYCYRKGFGYLKFEDLWNRFREAPDSEMSGPDLDSTIHFNSRFSEVEDEEQLYAFLASLPIVHGTKRQSISARKRFDSMYLEARTLVAGILTEAEKDRAKTRAGRLEDRLRANDRLYDYQKLRKITEEKGNYTVYSAEDITPADLENVILSAVPKDENGNLTPMNHSALNRQFSGKRLTRQHLGEIISGQAPITRYDLLTLNFFVHSQAGGDSRKKRYTDFIESSNLLLGECNFGPLYAANPYEVFLLICMLADDPLGTYADVWEMSYDRTENPGG